MTIKSHRVSLHTLIKLNEKLELVTSFDSTLFHMCRLQKRFRFHIEAYRLGICYHISPSNNLSGLLPFPSLHLVAICEDCTNEYPQPLIRSHKKWYFLATHTLNLLNFPSHLIPKIADIMGGFPTYQS